MVIRQSGKSEAANYRGWCLVAALLVQTCCGCHRGGDVRPPSHVPLRRLYESEFRLTPSGSMRRQFVFSPNGQLIAGSNWNEVRLWTFPEGELLHDFSHEVQSNCIGFSADGKEFLALDQRGMESVRFDVASGKLLGKTKLADVEKEQGATNFSISNDGRWLLMTEIYGNCAVWDITTGTRQFRKKIGGSTIRDDILTFYNGAWIEQYDVRTGEQLSRKLTKHHLTRAIGNASGSIWVGYSEEKKGIAFWDSAKDEYVGVTIPCEEREWRSGEAAISNDGNEFVYHVAHGPTIFDWKMAVFDVTTGNILREFDPPGTYFMEQPVISPDGRYMFLVGDRAVFIPIDLSTGKPVRDVPDPILAVGELSFTPDAKTLLVGSFDKRQAWHVETGKPGVTFVTFRHNPPYIAAIDDRSAVVTGFRDGGIEGASD